MKKKECGWYDVCPMKRFYKAGKLNKKWIENYCMVSNADCVRRRMEERGEEHSDNMLPDGSIDENLPTS